MSNQLIKKPNLIDIYQSDALVEIKRQEDLNIYLDTDVPQAWVKVNKFANNSKYLPIDKVEWLLRKIFKAFRIEITGQGVAFNGVWVSVRLHYLHPVTNKWEFHDGIGASEMQTAKGTSPADLVNINKNALSMAFPVAKSYAIKDASHHFGNVFGANLNRMDIVKLTTDNNPVNLLDDLVELFELKKDNLSIEQLENYSRIIENKEHKSYQLAIDELKEL
jgi:hypothetical protein